MPAIQETPFVSPVGRDTPRVDGPRKVSGQAQYTADFHFPGMLYAVPVEATIANGKLVRLDTAAAEKMPGVRAIFCRENIGKIFRSVMQPGFESVCDERRPPFEDDVIRYYGQYIALAVADTFEAATAAADAVRATYVTAKPNVETGAQGGRRAQRSGNDVWPIPAFGKPPRRAPKAPSPARRSSSITPTSHRVETHNPLELHSTTAIWEGARG